MGTRRKSRRERKVNNGYDRFWTPLWKVYKDQDEVEEKGKQNLENCEGLAFFGGEGG